VGSEGAPTYESSPALLVRPLTVCQVPSRDWMRMISAIYQGSTQQVRRRLSAASRLAILLDELTADGQVEDAQGRDHGSGLRCALRRTVAAQRRVERPSRGSDAPGPRRRVNAGRREPGAHPLGSCKFPPQRVRPEKAPARPGPPARPWGFCHSRSRGTTPQRPTRRPDVRLSALPSAGAAVGLARGAVLGADPLGRRGRRRDLPGLSHATRAAGDPGREGAVLRRLN
jgi:hypothetical protein